MDDNAKHASSYQVDQEILEGTWVCDVISAFEVRDMQQVCCNTIYIIYVWRSMQCILPTIDKSESLLHLFVS